MKYLKLFEDINPHQELLDKLSKFNTDDKMDNKEKTYELNNKEKECIHFHEEINFIMEDKFKYEYRLKKRIYLYLRKLDDDYYKVEIRIKNEKHKIEIYNYKLDQFVEFKKFFEILNNYFNKL